MTENNGYTHPKVLVNAEWVQAHLMDPSIRLIEVDVDTVNAMMIEAHPTGCATRCPSQMK
jgi:hypothetical protein